MFKSMLVVSCIFVVSVFCMGNTNLYAVDTAQIYTDNCEMCHGPDGKGTQVGIDFGSPDITDKEWQATRTDEDFVNSITNGNPDNPNYIPFGDILSEEEITAMAGHMRTFAQ